MHMHMHVDDQFAIAANDNNIPGSRTRAIDLVRNLATCYDDSMIMENEASNIIAESNKIENDI